MPGIKRIKAAHPPGVSNDLISIRITRFTRELYSINYITLYSTEYTAYYFIYTFTESYDRDSVQYSYTSLFIIVSILSTRRRPRLYSSTTKRLVSTSSKSSGPQQD